MVSLNLFVDLPKVREAFDARTLQMFNIKPGDNCRYDGPCAVGVCFDPDTRVSMPNLYIGRLIDSGRVTVPVHQRNDWCNLQLIHDLGNRTEFASFLEYLEGRYAQP